MRSLETVWQWDGLGAFDDEDWETPIPFFRKIIARRLLPWIWLAGVVVITIETIAFLSTVSGGFVLIAILGWTLSQLVFRVLCELAAVLLTLNDRQKATRESTKKSFAIVLARIDAAAVQSPTGHG